jgi:molecular chaperone DnaJ
LGSNKITNTVDFEIPKDLMTGQIFTYKGMGDDIVNGISGDLSVEVVVKNHKDFKVLGKDLLYEPRVSILDIILGKEITIPYFGTKITTAIPANSGINSRFTLRGKGLNGGTLIVQPEIKMPLTLTPEEREKLKSLSEGENFKIDL